MKKKRFKVLIVGISMCIFTVVFYEVKSINSISNETLAESKSKEPEIAKIEVTKKPIETKTETETERVSSALIHVPIIKQKPELYNGCEVTSLTMLLNWAGVSVNKLQVADRIQKDPTPKREDSSGEIIYWGNPNRGFVGDITGVNEGYSVNHGPIVELLDEHLPGKGVDLTGSSFQQILDNVIAGKPVVIWSTIYFVPTNNWETWDSPDGLVKATFQEHCVLLVGFNQDKKVVYVNDPFDGAKAKAVPMDNFVKSWEQLGCQAVTIK